MLDLMMQLIRRALNYSKKCLKVAFVAEQKNYDFLPIIGDAVGTTSEQELIDYVNSQNTFWKAGKFSQKSRNDMLKTLMKDPEVIGFQKMNNQKTKIFPSQLDMPPSFDARETWPKCVSIPLINDISECQSSWAFAAAESMSDRHCINSSGATNTILSAQELLSCCTGVLACGKGCEGGNQFEAWQYWKKHGLPTGGSYASQFGCKPYSIAPCGKTVDNVTYPACSNITAATPLCEKKCRDGYPVELNKDRHYGVSVNQLDNRPAEIQNDLMLHGPLQMTFEVYDDFLQYTTGIYVHLAGDKRGHLSARLLGWGQYEGVPYWLLANSWGKQWGENGTFRVLRGVNECGIEANCVSGLPKLE
uniref:Pept_C1 domain-containing protein n=2 Tax=Caenorhabditis japonica TaxID=281687 RepID=A0A8R1HLS4_CAEJA